MKKLRGDLGGIWLQRNAKILVSKRRLKGVHPKETRERESNNLDREKKRSTGLEFMSRIFLLGFYSTR
jgi:hypothetical protein